MTNKADGSFTFTAVQYAQPGTYTYTIRELEPETKAPGVTYDGVNKPITILVTVTDVSGVLQAKANISNENIQFENTYTAKPAQVIFNGTKIFRGAALEDNAFTFHLYQTDHFFDITSGNAELLESAGNVNDAFSFARTLNTTGTYFFVVVEDATANTLDNVVYDRTQYKFAVQVDDNGAGQLTATVTNVSTGISGEAAASAVADVTFVNATFDKVTEKEVYLADVTTQIDGQKVKAGDVLTYFITYTNYTGEDVVADIMDTIPNHTTYVENSASHDGTYVGTHLRWSIHVSKGDSVTVSFEVKVTDEEVIFANTAVVRDGVNTYTTNGVVNHTVEKVLTKDVYAPEDTTVSIDGQKVKEGDELIYKITFTNATANAVNIVITDKIPAFTTYIAGSAEYGGVYDEGELSWNLENIPAWATVTVAFRVQVNADAGEKTIENQATATDGTNDFTTNIVSNPVEKTVTPIIPDPGTTVPQTGDTAILGLWSARLAASSVGILSVLTFRIKKKSEEE